MQTAGERAAEVLPALLSLVENSVDALAKASEAAEAAASGQPIEHATLHMFSDECACPPERAAFASASLAA